MTWPRAILAAIAVAIPLAACVTASTHEDEAAVRALVNGRASLELPPRPDPDEPVAAAVKALLARPLSAEGAVRVALANNRRVRAIFAELGLARAGLVGAGLLENPELSADALFGDEEGAVADLELSQGLRALVLRGAATRAAESELDAARARVAGELLALAARVRSAHVRLQAAEQALALSRRAAEASGAAVLVAERLVEAGNVPKLDLASERATHADALLALADDELSARVLRERLGALLGLWGSDASWSIAPELPPPPRAVEGVTEVEQRAVDASLELAAARLSLDAAARNAGLRENARWLPDVSLGVGAEREDGEWRAGPSVSIALPIFDRGQGEVVRARARHDLARAEYHATAVDVRAAARALRERVLLARERVRFVRETLLPAQDDALREAQLHFNAMELGVFELLERRRRQFDAQRRAVRALEEYWLARGDLRLLLEGRLPEGWARVRGSAARDGEVEGEGSEEAHR